jgi:hypothetical protein
MSCINTKRSCGRKKTSSEKVKKNNSVSSGAYWDEYSEASDFSREKQREPKHSRRTTTRAREENHARSISTQPSDEEEDFVQETPEAALVVAQVYLLTTQPEPGDPREHMHQATIKSLGLVEDRLRKHSPEKKSTCYEDKGKRSIKYQSSQSQISDSSGDEKCRARREDARNIIAQTRVNKARYAWMEENYEDDEKEMARYALPEGFAEREYLKDLNCHTISKSTMGRKNLNYGYQTTFRQYKYLEEQEQRRCKVCNYTSRAQHGLG